MVAFSCFTILSSPGKMNPEGLPGIVLLHSIWAVKAQFRDVEPKELESLVKIVHFTQGLLDQSGMKMTSDEQITDRHPCQISVVWSVLIQADHHSTQYCMYICCSPGSHDWVAISANGCDSLQKLRRGARSAFVAVRQHKLKRTVRCCVRRKPR